MIEFKSIENKPNVIIMGKKDCKACNESYEYFKSRDDIGFLIYDEFKNFELKFKRLVSDELKKHGNIEVSYPIIIIIDEGEYKLYYGFSKKMFDFILN